LSGAVRVGAAADWEGWDAVSASCTTGVLIVFMAGAVVGAGAVSTGAGGAASGAGGTTAGGGGVTATGAAVSVACASKGVEDKAITAAIAVIAGRSGERFVFIAPDQSATMRESSFVSDEMQAIRDESSALISGTGSINLRYS